MPQPFDDIGMQHRDVGRLARIRVQVEQLGRRSFKLRPGPPGTHLTTIPSPTAAVNATGQTSKPPSSTAFRPASRLNLLQRSAIHAIGIGEADFRLLELIAAAGHGSTVVIGKQ